MGCWLGRGWLGKVIILGIKKELYIFSSPLVSLQRKTRIRNNYHTRINLYLINFSCEKELVVLDVSLLVVNILIGSFLGLDAVHHRRERRVIEPSKFKIIEY